jgi:DNA damage-binding protein 1
MLIPVPAPQGGVIVIGESVIAYFAEGQPMKVTPIKQTIIRVRLPAPSCLCAQQDAVG